MINHQDYYKNGKYMFNLEGQLYDEWWVKNNLRVRPQTVYKRLSEGGMSLREALELDKKSDPKKRIKRGITINGVTKTIYEWSKLTGVPNASIRYRLGIGKDGIDALISPKLGDIYNVRQTLIDNNIIEPGEIDMKEVLTDEEFDKALEKDFELGVYLVLSVVVGFIIMNLVIIADLFMG